MKPVERIRRRSLKHQSKMGLVSHPCKQNWFSVDQRWQLLSLSNPVSHSIIPTWSFRPISVSGHFFLVCFIFVFFTCRKFISSLCSICLWSLELISPPHTEDLVVQPWLPTPMYSYKPHKYFLCIDPEFLSKLDLTDAQLLKIPPWTPAWNWKSYDFA